MAHIRPLDNQPLRFVAGPDSNPVAEPSSGSPRAQDEAHSEEMHCALLEWAASQDHLALHLQAALVRLAKLMDEGGCIALSQAEIAPRVRLSERQTRTIIKELVGAGVLLRKRRGSIGKGRSCDLLVANRDTGAALPVSVDNSDAADNGAPSPISPDNGSAPPVSPPLPVSGKLAPETSPACTRVEDSPLEVMDLVGDPQPSEQVDRSDSCGFSILRLLPETVRRIVESVDHPKLNPTKASGLVTNSRHPENWLKAGLSEADIVEVILAKLSKPNGCGEFVQCWTYFDKPIRALTTKRKREAAKAKAQIGAAPCFDELWAMWPPKGRKRSDKAAALEALTKRTEPPAAILATARAYLAETDAQFVKGLDGWLKRRLDGCLDQTPAQGVSQRQAWVIEMEEEIQRRGVQ